MTARQVARTGQSARGCCGWTTSDENRRRRVAPRQHGIVLKNSLAPKKLLSFRKKLTRSEKSGRPVVILPLVTYRGVRLPAVLPREHPAASWQRHGGCRHGCRLDTLKRASGHCAGGGPCSFSLNEFTRRPGVQDETRAQKEVHGHGEDACCQHEVCSGWGYETGNENAFVHHADGGDEVQVGEIVWVSSFRWRGSGVRSPTARKPGRVHGFRRAPTITTRPGASRWVWILPP